MVSKNSPHSTRVHKVLTLFIHSIHALVSNHTCYIFISNPFIHVMFPINTILFLLPVSIRHSFTSFQNFHISYFFFPLLAFIGIYTQIHTYFTIPTFPTTHSILDPFHPCASMLCYILGNIRNAHLSFLLPLLFSSTPHHTTLPSIFSYTLLSPYHTIFLPQNSPIIPSFLK